MQKNELDLDIAPMSKASESTRVDIGLTKSKSKSKTKHSDSRLLSPIENQTKKDLCGLCGTVHGPGSCSMTESSENLAKYREMLIMNTEDESYEERVRSLSFLSIAFFNVCCPV